MCLQIKDAKLLSSPPGTFQIVGHSIAINKIRSTSYLYGIGIDGGMYLGGRVYLRINDLRRITSISKVSGSWKSVDITEKECGF